MVNSPLGGEVRGTVFSPSLEYYGVSLSSHGSPKEVLPEVLESRSVCPSCLLSRTGIVGRNVVPPSPVPMNETSEVQHLEEEQSRSCLFLFSESACFCFVSVAPFSTREARNSGVLAEARAPEVLPFRPVQVSSFSGAAPLARRLKPILRPALFEVVVPILKFFFFVFAGW